jgi:AcrR family transcriptional regulator
MTRPSPLLQAPRNEKDDEAPSRQRSPLTKQRIVEAALTLIGQEGLAACNMRRLAADLDVAPMSIYYHIPSKSDLLEAVCDGALADITLPPDDVSWDEGARIAAYEARRVGRSYPELLQILFDPERPTVKEFSKRCAELCMAMGFSEEDAWTAVRTIGRYVIGSVVADLQQLRSNGFAAGSLAVPHDEWMASENGESLERIFEDGLSAVIAGLGSLRRTTV